MTYGCAVAAVPGAVGGVDLVVEPMIGVREHNVLKGSPSNRSNHKILVRPTATTTASRGRCSSAPLKWRPPSPYSPRRPGCGLRGAPGRGGTRSRRAPGRSGCTGRGPGHHRSLGLDLRHARHRVLRPWTVPPDT